jgi:hypothetical protein
VIKAFQEAASRLIDSLSPGDDTLHVRLIRRGGEAHSGLYKDGDQETVSPKLPRTKRDDR